MDHTLTIVDTPSTTAGSVLSLRDRIEDLMAPLAPDPMDRRQSTNWQFDDELVSDPVGLAHVGVHFEDS